MYATREDIEQVYGQTLVQIIADLTQDGTPEDEAIDQAIAEASSEIDAFLAVRYPVVPITPVPKILTQLARDMAVYRMALGAGGRTTEMRTRYEDAIKMLERLASGKATLPIAPVEEDTDGDGDVDEDDVQRSPFLLRTVRGG